MENIEQLIESQQRAILDNIPDIVWLKDKESRFIAVNQSFAAACGLTQSELVGKTDLDIWPKELAESYRADDFEVMKSKARKCVQERLVDKEGKFFWIETIKTPILNDKAEVIGTAGIARDVTERVKVEEKLIEMRSELDIRVRVRTAEINKTNEELLREIAQRKKIESELSEANQNFKELFNNISSGVAVYRVENNGMDFIFKDFNKAAEQIEGVKKESVIGKNVAKVFPAIIDTGLFDVFKNVHQTGIPEFHPAAFYKNKKIAGWRENHIYKLPTGEIVALYNDVTERKNNEFALLKSNAKLKELSLVDSLTGLYSYRYLTEAIEVEFHRARRYVHSLAVTVLDIDYFKSINDLYGITFGDLVLNQFADELKRLLRRYDIVIRSGGEEFLVISPGINRQQAIHLAGRLQDTLNFINFGNKEHTVKLRVSLATVSFPDDRASKGIDLVNLVNQILNLAKDMGGNRVYSSADLSKKNKPRGLSKNKSADINVLKEKLDKLVKKTNQGSTESIFAFAKTIELKDHYTGEHVEKTVYFATQIAKGLKIPKDELVAIQQAAMLHDLGKIGISENILLKKGKLTKEEFEEIKKHPQIGADIIRPVHFLRDIIPLILYHHERWDGKGYLGGLKGENIPVGARIIAIADVYQALTSDRPYHKAFSKKEAINIIKEGSGTQFDSRIISVFLKVIKQEK